MQRALVRRQPPPAEEGAEPGAMIASPRRGQAFARAAAFFQGQAPLWIGVVMVLAYMAQGWLDKRQMPIQAVALYLLAALLFLALFRREAAEASRQPAAETTSVSHPRWAWVGLALVLGAASFFLFEGNRFTPLGMALWVPGLVCLLIGARGGRVWKATRSEDAAPRTSGAFTVTWTHLAVLGIVLLGAFYRLYQLDVFPNEMGVDQPHNYNNVRHILRSEFLIYFPSYPGREGLFFYLAAGLARLFGLSYLTIKITAALVGVATLPLIYLLGKELYNREVGLYSAFFLSLSYWHLYANRYGYRVSVMPLLIITALLFFVRGVKTERPWPYALSGLSLGLVLYTYTAAMIAPLAIALAALACWLFGGKRWLRANWGSVLLLGIVALYVFIPLGRYAYDEPQMYGFRAATRITGREAPLPLDVIKTLLLNTRNTLWMFNYTGDAVSISNIPFMRELSFGMAILFVLGLIYVLWRWRKGFNLTNLIAFGVMLLPSILSIAFPNEVPNANRAMGALPSAMLFCAVALMLVRRRLWQAATSTPRRLVALTLRVDEQVREWRFAWGQPGRWVVVAMLVLYLALEARVLYPLYFVEYPKHWLYQGYYALSLSIAEAIDAFHGNGPAFTKVHPYWYDGNSVRAQLRLTDQNWNGEITEINPARPPLSEVKGKFMIVVHPEEKDSLQRLQDLYPKGVAITHKDNSGKPAFITFYGEK